MRVQVSLRALSRSTLNVQCDRYSRDGVFFVPFLFLPPVTMTIPHQSLTRRLRVLVQLAAFNAMGQRKRARLLVTRELRRSGLSPEFFSEVYIHLSLFLGYPLMLDGLEHLA